MRELTEAQRDALTAAWCAVWDADEFDGITSHEHAALFTERLARAALQAVPELRDVDGIDLGKPYAIALDDGAGLVISGYGTAQEAWAHAADRDKQWPSDAPHIVVKLSATRVQKGGG